MKILLVEDVRSIAALMNFRLAQLGHEVVHAPDGAAAVEAFKAHAPDLVLMDIEMPVMNGFEATTRIRAEEARRKWAWTPIIFLTVSDTATNLLTAIEAGGDDFLAKTVPEEVLYAKIKAMSRIAQLRSALCSANARLEELATRDPLTGVYNRRHMDMRVDQLWDLARVGQQAQGVAVLMIDVDNFKRYNDMYGHQAGDNCLIRVADAINSAVACANRDAGGKDAFVARYGGEEFVVVIPQVSDEEMRHYADALLEAVRVLQIGHEGNTGHGIVTFSIGGKRVEPAADAIADAFRGADAALYVSKEQGRNRATFS